MFGPNAARILLARDSAFFALTHPTLVNTPNPALVSQRAVQRLPRLALWLLCAAYVLPGVFGRDPWKNADVTAVGYMFGLLRGDASWLNPTIAGIGSEGSLLPYWIGAASMYLLGDMVGPVLAARLPFALMLAGTLALVWYATLHLARTEAAQPLPFAFGGEADPVDYARAIADGSVLALISVLGLLQLGHETTPELVQLLGAALFIYGLAAGPYRRWQSRLGVFIALPVMAASGAATTSVLLALAGSWVCLRSSSDGLRQLLRWTLASGLLAAVTAWALGGWIWRIPAQFDALSTLRLLAWFTWPVWPLVAWTLWQWRRHILRRHLAIPLTTGGVGVIASLAMGGSDRALMLALPALAVLAAFALPTLRRSMGAAIDWFSVFFFSACAISIWVIYAAMHTGTPAKIAANVTKLTPGFEAVYQAPALLLAVLGTLTWLGLVRWRTGRNQHAMWKSLVLPAGGVALNWLLLMTLWLPLLDYARSYRPLIQRVAQQLPAGACINTDGLTRSQLAALTVHGDLALAPQPDDPACDWLLVAWNESRNLRFVPPSRTGWRWIAKAERPTDRAESILIYRRR